MLAFGTEKEALDYFRSMNADGCYVAKVSLPDEYLLESGSRAGWIMPEHLEFFRAPGERYSIGDTDD